jgi:hypothetical protein
MQEVYKLLIGIALLILGIFLGNFLARITKEELKQGKIYFQYLILFSLIAAIVFLILGNDALLFAFLFIAIVTSRSVKK